jgi:hypothetical protein
MNIHFHTDVDLLSGNFVDKHGVPIMVAPNLFGYFMQKENIVKLVYSKEQAISYLNAMQGKKIEPIYFFVNK